MSFPTLHRPDDVLRIVQACADMPCVLFIDELVAAYPDAKVILTNRNPDKWVTSMRKTVFEVVSWPSWKMVAHYDQAITAPWYSFARTILASFPGGGDRREDYMSSVYAGLARRRFLEHYDHVRKVVPKDNLLEFRSEDGWGPMCEFLGKEVPEGEYPYINDSKNFVRVHKFLWWRAASMAFVKTVLPVAITVGAVYAWKLYSRQ